MRNSAAMKKPDQRRRERVLLSSFTVTPVNTASKRQTANQDCSFCNDLEAEIQLWQNQQRLDQTIIAELAGVQAK